MKYLLFILLALVSCKQRNLTSSLHSSAASSCTDEAPDHRYTCAQQAGWGKCGESWMANKCNLSCGRCSVSQPDFSGGNDSFVSRDSENGGEYTPSGNTGDCSYVSSNCSNGGGSDCSIYSDGGNRADVKSEIWNTMYKYNRPLGEQAAKCRADLAVAMAMQESHDFNVDHNGNLSYDYHKDYRSDGAQNVSIFNMNIHFIKSSCKIDCAKFQNFGNQSEKMYLNKRAHLKEAVRRLSEGFDHFGVTGTLHFHRGGSSGHSNPSSDEMEFADSLKKVAHELYKNPEQRLNGNRISHTIHYR